MKAKYISNPETYNDLARYIENEENSETERRTDNSRTEEELHCVHKQDVQLKATHVACSLLTQNGADTSFDSVL